MRRTTFNLMATLAALAFLLSLLGCKAKSTSVIPATTPQPVTIVLTAQNQMFDQSIIGVAAGASVTIQLNNKDVGLTHNFALYRTQGGLPTEVIFRGDPVTGPGTITYKFTAPSTPGTYLFRDDDHPTLMTGLFIVT